MFQEWLSVRGRAAYIASALGVREVNVTRWKQSGVVPADRCPAVERLTGIPAESLNPNVKWRRVRCAGWPLGKPLRDGPVRVHAANVSPCIGGASTKKTTPVAPGV